MAGGGGSVGRPDPPPALPPRLSTRSGRPTPRTPQRVGSPPPLRAWSIRAGSNTAPLPSTGVATASESLGFRRGSSQAPEALPPYAGPEKHPAGTRFESRSAGLRRAQGEGDPASPESSPRGVWRPRPPLPRRARRRGSLGSRPLRIRPSLPDGTVAFLAVGEGRFSGVRQAPRLVSGYLDGARYALHAV